MQQRNVFKLVRSDYCMLVLAVMTGVILMSPATAQNSGLLGKLTGKADEPVSPDLALNCSTF